METVTFWAVWIALGGAMLLYYFRRTHKILSVLCGVLSGWTALAIVHYLGNIIGFAPEFNAFNLMQSAILGVPGVILMIVMHFIL